MKKILALVIIGSIGLYSCDFQTRQATSDSGVQKASVKVNTNSEGHTIEQENYIHRVKEDNEPGSIKHLYIISAYTGDVLEYSTVKGKVTSGGKRLSPTTVNGSAGISVTGINTNTVQMNGNSYVTDEVPDEYGMYGTSSPYFYWFDAQGNYHQYYPSGGTFVHVSDRPLRVKKANWSVTMEQSDTTAKK